MEFKLPKFKLKLKPDVVIKDYEVNYVRSGRKEKSCCECGNTIKVGEPSTTFLKRTKLGNKTGYHTQYTCGGKRTACTINRATTLNVTLP